MSKCTLSTTERNIVASSTKIWHMDGNKIPAVWVRVQQKLHSWQECESSLFRKKIQELICLIFSWLLKNVMKYSDSKATIPLMQILQCKEVFFICVWQPVRNTPCVRVNISSLNQWVNYETFSRINVLSSALTACTMSMIDSCLFGAARIIQEDVFCLFEHPLVELGNVVSVRPDNTVCTCAEKNCFRNLSHKNQRSKYCEPSQLLLHWVLTGLQTC